jgi:hypothetical protein
MLNKKEPKLKKIFALKIAVSKRDSRLVKYENV